MQTCKLEQVVHNSINMLSKRTAEKSNYREDRKMMSQQQDGDCILRRTQTQPKRPTLKTFQLRNIEKDSMNTIVENNRSKIQRSRRKNDQ